MSDIKRYRKQRLKRRRQQDENVDFEERLRMHKKRMLILILSIIAFLLVVAISVKLYIDNRVFDGYEVESVVNSGETYGCSFYEFSKCFLRCSNDGITYMNGKDVMWNQPFEMKTPLIDVCGSTVAIAESGGVNIYIYNSSGALGEVPTKYPIQSLDVSEQGVVAAITLGEGVNYIEVYDKEGNQLAWGQASLSGESGYPIDLSISNDGQKMIASYLYVDGSDIQNKIVFYNFSEVGKNEVDRIVGVFVHYGTTILPKVEFISNNVAVAFGDDIMTIYSMKQKPSIVYEDEVSNVKSVFYSKDYIGLVMETDDAEKPYRVRVIDGKGKKLLDKKTDIEYTGVKLDGKNVILYNDIEMQVISFNGVVKFDGEYEEEITDILITGKQYVYYVVTPTGVKKVKLK